MWSISWLIGIGCLALFRSFSHSLKYLLLGGDDSDPRQQQGSKEVDNEELYKVMGIDKKADINDIKKSYKKACLKGDYRHPDKGGDPEKVSERAINYD